MTNWQIRVEELHTLRQPYKDKKYLESLPHYLPSQDGVLGDKEKAKIIRDWTESLAKGINNRPHNPRSDILFNSQARAKISRKYKKEDDETGREWKHRYLAEKDSSKWATFNNLISNSPTEDNPWFSSGSIPTGGARLGSISSWGYSSKEFIKGMIENKVNESNNKRSKHYVGKQGEKSRIFDLLNGYYYITAEDAEAIAQLLPFILKFIAKINQEDDYLFLREYNPNTGEKISPNQEQIQYSFENPNDIYHTNLRFQTLEEVKIAVEQEIDLDLDLVIKYWMAQEKLHRGEIDNPMKAMGRVMAFFNQYPPYAKELDNIGMDKKQLSQVIKDSQNLLDEINELDGDELQAFVDDNKSQIEIVMDFETTEEYVFNTIKISNLLNKIKDDGARKALADFKPPPSAGRGAGQSVADKMKQVAVEKMHFLIWITNDPVEVINQNTSQKWGQRSEEMWNGERVNDAGLSCINFNGQYGCGPYFDFYNGNGVAFVALIDEDIINDYKLAIKSGDKKKYPNLAKMSPEDLFNSGESEIVGRMSLRWGDKRNIEGGKIGWGIGLETTIYPKKQGWAFPAFQGVARILKQIKDNSGNSIWDSSLNERGEPMQKIKAPYKMGWAYLDYNNHGYYGEIPEGDYDCKGLGNSQELVPNYNQGLRFGRDTSRAARAVQLQEGVELDYDEYVRFEFRDFQEITQGLLTDIRLYGSIDPGIYRTVAQNPQIWVSETSLASVINGLFSNTRQEQYQPIRKEFLDSALDSSSQNISWLLQYPVNETSIAGTLDMYDTTKTWNYGENCLLKTIYNHTSVMETFKGHTPDISIQEHLYNQKIKLVDSATGRDFAMASDLFLLDLNIKTGKAPARMIDNAVLSDMIQKLKSSAKKLGRGKIGWIRTTKNIFPNINIDWTFWGSRTETANALRRNKELLLAYYQLKTIHNLSYSPRLSTTNYKTLCEVMGIIYKFLHSTPHNTPRSLKKLMNDYYKTYKALTMNLLYDKSDGSSICYSDNNLFTSIIHPKLLDSSSVMAWAWTSLYGISPPSQFSTFNESERSYSNNPLTQLLIYSDDVLSIDDLQNTICINAWDNIPIGELGIEQYAKAYKLYMYYYLYHFRRSPRIFNKVFNSYMSFITTNAKTTYTPYPNGSFPLTAILLDALVGKNGNLLPNNPFIDNKQIEKLYPYLNPELVPTIPPDARVHNNIELPTPMGSFSQLRPRVFGGDGRAVVAAVRESFGSDGLNAFIGLILGYYSDFAPQQYGIDNLFKLLRTPAQFRMAERAMLKLSLGPYFEVNRRGHYIFKVPTELQKLSETELVDLVYNDMDAYSRREDIQSDIEIRLNQLKNYLIILAQNPYIPQSMQSRLILTTQNTNAFSKSVKIIETTQGRGISQSEINVHYSDIFTLYGSNIYNEVRYREIVAELVKNPIIGIPTINQIVTYIDESLVSQLILNAKFDLDAEELMKQKDIINETLFDNAPAIIEGNPAISDEIRLKLFEIYLNNIFKMPMKDMTDSLKILRDFAYDSGDRFNFRDATDYGKFQSALQKLNFNNIGMWRGGFGKFGLNKFIPPDVIREGDSICEQPIIKQKPQLIIDVNFKPPYDDVYISQDGGFVSEETQQELEEIESALEELSMQIQTEVEGLGWDDYEDLENNMEEDMAELEEYGQLRHLLYAKSRKQTTKRDLKGRKGVIRQSAPINTTIRYIDNKEETQNGIKLSGMYWDSGRKRMSNKWSEIYPDWNSVYGAGNYGERGDGEIKKWKNQITLVFFDNNPNISWNPISSTGTELPKWRMEDKYCNSDAFSRTIEFMLSNMKSPEQNLIPFLLTLTDFIEKSGNFRWKLGSGEILSRNPISLLSGNNYYVSVGSREGRLNLGWVFTNIDVCNLWPYLEYAGTDEAFYTDNKIALLMFLSGLVQGQRYANYKRPAYALIDLLCNIDTASDYYQALANSGILISLWPEGTPYDEGNITGVFECDLGKLGRVGIRARGPLYLGFDYTSFCQTTGFTILSGMGNSIEGVADDISIYATIYQASISRPNSNIHSFTRNALLERQEDWVTYMREQGEMNPEGIVQEAEEYNTPKKESLNIDDKKMEKYIRLILGGNEDAQSNVS